MRVQDHCQITLKCPAVATEGGTVDMYSLQTPRYRCGASTLLTFTPSILSPPHLRRAASSVALALSCGGARELGRLRT